MPPDAVLDEVRAWLRKADADLRNNDLVLPADDCPLDAVCFHAQQAAEKCLKAYLTYFGIAFPKIHDLEEIAALVPPDKALALDPDDLAELSQLGVAPRYPGWDAVDRAFAARADTTARHVRSVVLAALVADGFKR